MDYELNTDEPQNSIKVTKNTRGYTWEIKRYFKEPGKSTEEVINWLKAVDNKLKTTFEEEKKEQSV